MGKEGDASTQTLMEGQGRGRQYTDSNGGKWRGKEGDASTQTLMEGQGRGRQYTDSNGGARKGTP